MPSQRNISSDTFLICLILHTATSNASWLANRDKNSIGHHSDSPSQKALSSQSHRCPSNWRVDVTSKSHWSPSNWRVMFNQCLLQHQLKMQAAYIQQQKPWNLQNLIPKECLHRKITSINILGFWSKMSYHPSIHIPTIHYHYPNKRVSSLLFNEVNHLAMGFSESKCLLWDQARCPSSWFFKDPHSWNTLRRILMTETMGHGVCDQFWDILLMTCYWGYWESTSSTIWFQLLCGLCTWISAW